VKQKRPCPGPIRRRCAIHEALEPRVLLSVNVTTYHYDNARDGANTDETVLTPSNVNQSTFGKVASFPVDGQIYAQPLVMTNVAVSGQGTHNVVYVATENDTVYAFDAAGNNPAQGYLWKTSLLESGETAVPQTDYSTTDITPLIGITGTPVIDPSTNTLYVVAATKTSSDAYYQRIWALDITSGAVKFGGPTTIVASVAGTGYGSSNGQVSFSAYWENQRPALTLANGEVYVAWASHGDLNPWHGWVIAFNDSTLHEDYIYCDTANGDAGGIWMSGGGIAVDANGDLYFSTGNGSFGGNDYAMSIEKMSPSLSLLDYFTPYNQLSLSNQDLDYGCSSVVLLPTQSDQSAPDEILTESKWGTAYLNNGDTGDMGEYNSNGSGPNDDLSEVSIGGTMHNTIAYWNGEAYIGGDGLTLKSYSVSGGSLGQTHTSATAHAFGRTSGDGSGTSPTISSNGTSDGIVWALDNSAYNNNPAVLYAYNANNLGDLLWSSDQAANGRDTAGNAVKFQSAVVANGYVYVGGGGSLTVYGLLPSTAVPTIVTPAAANPTVAGASTVLSVSATDPSPDQAPSYSWAATTIPSGATAPSFSVNGSASADTTTATFHAIGSYGFTVTVTDPSSGLNVTSSVTVTVTVPSWVGAGSAATWDSSTHVLAVTGPITIASDPGTDQPIIEASGAGAVVTLNLGAASPMHLGGLDLTGGASVIVTPGAGAANQELLVLGQAGATSAPMLVIDSTSKLDLSNVALVVHGGNAVTINPLLTPGYNTSAGTGIVSSNGPGGSLYVLRDVQVASAVTFNGESVTTTDVEVAQALFYDFNMDGVLDSADFTAMNANYSANATGVNNGDFNADGVFNGSDFTLMDNVYNSQVTGSSAQLASAKTQLASAPSPPRGEPDPSELEQLNCDTGLRPVLDNVEIRAVPASHPTSTGQRPVSRWRSAAVLHRREHAKSTARGSLFSGVLILPTDSASGSAS
jgi:hypothetical protein